MADAARRWLDLFPKFLIAALLGAIACIIDSQIREGSGPESKFRVLEYGILLVTLFSLPRLLSQTRLQITLPVASALLMAGYFLVRGLIDPVRGFALDNGFQTMAWLIFAVLAAYHLKSNKDWTAVLFAAVVFHVFPIVYAIGETFDIDIYFRYWRGVEGYWMSDLAEADRAIIWSSLGNPNYFAIFAGQLLLILCMLFSITKRIWLRVSIGVYAAAVIYTIAWSFSRGIIVSLAGAFALAAVFLAVFYCFRLIGWRQALRIYGKPVGIAFASVVILFTLAFGVEQVRGGGPLHRVGERFYNGITLRDASLRARPLMWTGALRMWRDEPLFGQGHGQYLPQFLENLFLTASEMEEQGAPSSRIRFITRQMNTIHSEYAHNDYVQLLAETGAVGYSLFLLLILSSLAAAVRRLWRNDLDPTAWRLLFGASLIIALTAIHAMYDFPLRLPASALYLGFALAVVFRCSKTPDMGVSIPLPLPGRIAIFIALTAACVSAAPLIVNHFHAAHYRFAAEQLLRQADAVVERDPERHLRLVQNARRLLEGGQTLHPGDGRLLAALGYAQSKLAALMGTQYRDAAIQTLERARLTFNSPDIYETLGYLYLQKAMFASAKEETEKLLMINDEEKDVNFLAGLVEFRMNQMDDAMRYFQNEIRINPGHAEAWAYIGRIHKDHFGNPEAAAGAYEQSAAIEPNVINTHFELGELYGYELNQPEKALEHYETALDLAQRLDSQRWIARIRVRQQELERRLSASG